MCARFVLSLVALVSLGWGCLPRVSTPTDEVGRTAEAGLPVRFGGENEPEREWRFEAGSPPIRGNAVSHVFARAGAYVVESQGPGGERRETVSVRPRAITRAAPVRTEFLAYLPVLTRNLDPLVDFTERLFGPDKVQETLEWMTLPDVVLESVAVGPEGMGEVDPQEGMGLFTLPDIRGAVVMVGVVDGEAFVARAVRRLEGRGARGAVEPDGTYRLRLPSGQDAALFLDRGYAYLAYADPASSGEPTDRNGLTTFSLSRVLLDRMVAHVRGSPDSGLESSPRLAEAVRALAPGQLQVLIPPGSAGDWLFAGALQLTASSALLDGRLHGDRPFFASVTPLRSWAAAPEHPVAALFASVEPRGMLTLVVGPPGSPRRQALLRHAGPLASLLEALLEGSDGSFALTAHFDAEAFYENLLNGTRKPMPKGQLALDMGLTKGNRVEQLAQSALRRSGLRGRSLEQGPFRSAFSTTVVGAPLELQLGAEALRFTAGPAPQGRRSVDLHESLRRRFGEDTFGVGHLSGMLDIARLSEELSAPRRIEGVDPQKLVELQAFTGQFLRELTPIDSVFFDVGPEPTGARLRGELRLRQR